VKGEREKAAPFKEGEALFSSATGIPYPIHIYVYEIKGCDLPRDVPEEGFEGIWPEPPFYYLFYRKQAVGPPGGAASASDGVSETDERLRQWLRSHPGWLLTSRYDLPYEKWQDVSIPQISLGSFEILLSGSPADDPATIPIQIDPGVVFGSGLHPATQGCLLAISSIFQDNLIHSAIDFGTGTGVLAIACALAGAKFVPAIDRNPLALKVARKNVRANRVERRVDLVEADSPRCLSIRPDLFIMNLEWPILRNILEAGDWRNSRRVVLAGFLENRLESVKELARPEFNVENVIRRDGWPTVTLKLSAG
jgi:ribosomal protein L11 methyltransferase